MSGAPDRSRFSVFNHEFANKHLVTDFEEIDFCAACDISYLLLLSRFGFVYGKGQPSAKVGHPAP
jgi:hypothetical protein